MTLKIEIHIPQEHIEAKSGATYLADAMAAIGFSRGVSLPMPAPSAPVAAPEETSSDDVADKEAVRQIEEAPKAKRTRKAKEEAPAEEKPLISTGEERIEPVSAEDEAQDAADEAADPANAPAEKASREDVRAAMLAFQNSKGPEALIKVMTAAFTDMFPDGSVKNLKAVPEDAAHFAELLKRIEGAQ